MICPKMDMCDKSVTSQFTILLPVSILFVLKKLLAMSCTPVDRYVMSLCIEIEILSCLFREMCPVDVTVVEFACLSILVLLLGPVMAR